MSKFLFLALVATTFTLSACGLEDTSGGTTNDCGGNCSAGTVCDRDANKCVADDDSDCNNACGSGTVCNKTTGKCDTGSSDCGGSCGSGTVCNTTTGKCDQESVTGDNYCIVYGVDSLTEVGYEVNRNAGDLGRGTWVSVGSKSGSNAKVRVDLQAPADPKAIRVSAKLPNGEYLAMYFDNPTLKANADCWLAGQKVTLRACPRESNSNRGAEGCGSVSGTIPNPIRTN